MEKLTADELAALKPEAVSNGVSWETQHLAEAIYRDTISAHYRHGLQEGQRLNFNQIAGEAIEAAIRFDRMMNAEATSGRVTEVIERNDAYASGFQAGKMGLSSKVPEVLDAKYHDDYTRGWMTATQA